MSTTASLPQTLRLLAHQSDSPADQIVAERIRGVEVAGDAASPLSVAGGRRLQCRRERQRRLVKVSMDRGPFYGIAKTEAPRV